MNKKRPVAVLTTGRQDYGVLRSLLLILHESPEFDLQLLVGGMHLSSLFGRTVLQIKADGLIPSVELDWLHGDETPIYDQAAQALRLVSLALRDLRPECILLVGDRFETVSAALAATFEGVPIVHLHGGEETEGAMDNVFRHAITKMAHLHLVSHPIHAHRVIQMGEHPDTVFVVGAPGLDNLFRDDLPDRSGIEKKLGTALKLPVIIVTLHPETTMDAIKNEAMAENLLHSMSAVAATYVITLPNADPHNEIIRDKFIRWASTNNSACAVEALGEKYFHALMREADLMIGNSSSALVEAPAYQLPVIDIGDRQKGRLCGDNVVHVDACEPALADIISEMIQPKWRERLAGTSSIFGAGVASQRIVEILRGWTPPLTPQKSFYQVKIHGD